MAGEGIVSIGATFDKTNVDAGLGSTQEMVKAAMESIGNDVTQAAAKTRSAWKNLSDDVKAAATTVTAESLKVAEATRLQAEAFADLRRAQILSRDASLSEAQQNAVLAVAQQKVAESTAQVAAAKQAEAEAVTAANEEEALSENVVVRAFQRAAASISESTAEIREQLVSTAETGGLTAEGLTAGFAGFGKLLGAGIAVGFATHYIDELAKVNVELEHLHAKTGISIESLAGLQQILKESGGDFETVATGLVRMESNTQKLGQGNKQLAEAFQNLGININEAWRAKPEELLQMIATGMSNTADANVRANSAITIFGRGGQALIPVLREQGAQLTANMKATGELTGITDESAEAARRWTQDTARLSAEFRSVMIPVMEHAEDVVRGIASVFELVAAVGVSAFELVATAVVAALAPIAKVGEALYDLITGNFRQMVVDANGSSTAFADAWKAGFNEIKGNWDEVYHTFHDNSKLPPLPQPGDEGGTGDVPTKPKKTRDTAFRNDEADLAALRLQTAQRGYVLGIDGEVKFWEARLAAAKKGSNEYKEIVAKLASLEEAKLKAGKRSKPEESADVSHIANLTKEFEMADSITAAMGETEVKNAKRAEREEVAAFREGLDEKIRLAAEGYKDAEQAANAEVRLGRMSSAQRVEAMRAAADREYQIELGLVHSKEALDMGEAQKYQQDLNRELQMTRQHAQQIAQINQQAALQSQQRWDKFFQDFNSKLNQTLLETQKNTNKASQYFAQMFGQLTAQLENWIVTWLEKKAEMWLKDEIQAKTAAISHHATQAAANVASVTGDAAVAAAGAMAYYSVINPPAAPAFAAAQLAMTMAYAPMAAFDKGGVVQGGGGMAVPVLAHAGERVLTPSQTQNFETLVNTRSSSSSSNNTLNMGGLEQHFHGNQPSPRDAARGMQDAIRRGRLRLA